MYKGYLYIIQYEIITVEIVCHYKAKQKYGMIEKLKELDRDHPRSSLWWEDK